MGRLRASPGTDGSDYTRRLLGQTAWWKRLLDVQRPYRWHLRHLRMGKMLDVGCGIGRNLVNLMGSGEGVGIDHNAESVAVARSRGLVAFTVDEFRHSPYAKEAGFDSILVAHVAEHLPHAEATELLRAYVPLLRAGGKVVLVAPQEAGFRSDPTHVEQVGFVEAARILRQCGLTVSWQYSFPFPRAFGRLFKYNEFVTVGHKPDDGSGSLLPT